MGLNVQKIYLEKIQWRTKARKQQLAGTAVRPQAGTTTLGRARRGRRIESEEATHRTANAAVRDRESQPERAHARSPQSDRRVASSPLFGKTMSWGSPGTVYLAARAVTHSSLTAGLCKLLPAGPPGRQDGAAHTHGAISLTGSWASMNTFCGEETVDLGGVGTNSETDTARLGVHGFGAQ